MDIIVSIIQVIFAVVAMLLALISIALFFRFQWPAVLFWGSKVVASALSPVFIIGGLLAFVVGITTHSLFTGTIGAYVTFIYLFHYISVTRPPVSTFNIDLDQRIDPEKQKYFLSSRTALKLPSVPEPRFEQDISFATIPGTDRKLLCDIWQPAATIKPSGIAFIYMHGSAFYFLDKDYGTRPFFKHLAAQGHVIMDIAYRLAPETDLMGMIHDVKRAIAWMKENAKKYAVDPDKIIVAGGSAGGYLALMAAFTFDDPDFLPADLREKDMSVCSVVALYPATDLKDLYYHTNQHLTTRTLPGKPKKKVPTEMPAWMKKRIGKDLHRLGMDKRFDNVGLTAPLLGGHPGECPERYEFYSPITHVHSNCPPSLLIQGQHDIMTPVGSTRLLYNKLKREKVPSLFHILPQTDHAFDLFLPIIAPAAHNAIYDIERFIALFTDKENDRYKLVTHKEANRKLFSQQTASDQF